MLCVWDMIQQLLGSLVHSFEFFIQQGPIYLESEWSAVYVSFISLNFFIVVIVGECIARTHRTPTSKRQIYIDAKTTVYSVSISTSQYS